MIHEKISLRHSSGYFETYFQSASPLLPEYEARPCIIICPGGAYKYCSDREAEPVAVAFAARGYHAAVLRYPVAPERFPEPLKAVAETILYLRTNAEKYHIDPDRIAVCGFSAGGHLAGSIGVFWHKDWLSGVFGCGSELLKPNRLLLCYAVLTAGEKTHQESIDCLLGPGATPEERDAVSLEKCVTDKTPPTFLWHTFSDQHVPVDNSLYFARALSDAGVPFELHVYQPGPHGLSLALEMTRDGEGFGSQPECRGWVELADVWLRGGPIK